VLFHSTADTIVAGILLTLVYLKTIQLLHPFADQQLNIIKETSLWQIFLVFFIALLIKMNDVNSDFLTASLILTFFANFLLMGWQWMSRSLVHGAKFVCAWCQVCTESRGRAPRPTDVEMSMVDTTGSFSIRKNSSTGVHVTDDARTQQSPFHKDQDASRRHTIAVSAVTTKLNPDD